MSLNIKRFFTGIQAVPTTPITIDTMGELQVLSSDGRLYYNNGTITSAFLTQDGPNVIKNTQLDDSTVDFENTSDITKKFRFDLSNITTGNTRVLIVPDSNGTLVLRDLTQTLTNKSLVDNSTSIIDNSDATKKILFDAGGTTGTSTTITGAQTTNRVLTLPDVTDTLTANAATQTLTNKTLTGNIAVNLVSGAATITLPTTTGTLATLANVETFTNKTIALASNSITGTANQVVIMSAGGIETSEANLAVSRGGTGIGTLTANNVLLGNGTSAIQVVAPSTSGNVLTSNGTTWTSASPSSSPTFGVTTKGHANNGYQILGSDRTLIWTLTNGLSDTTTLPAANAVTGQEIIIKSTSGTNQNTLTINRSGSDNLFLLNGTNVTSLVSYTSGETWTLRSDSSGAWYVVKHECHTPWLQYIPSFTGFGTVSSISAFYRRIGDSVEVWAAFTTGTNTGVEARIDLPNSWTIDTTKIQANTSGNPGTIVGQHAQVQPNVLGYLVTATTTSTAGVYFGDIASGTQHLTAQLGNSVYANNVTSSAKFIVPVSGFLD